MIDAYRSYLSEGEHAGQRYVLRVPKNVPLGMAGSYLGHRAASSLEFKDHREYQPGDDLRRIDWGAYARSDKLTVKLFREEVNPHLDIVIDGSRSMALENTVKVQAALGLAAVFAVSAVNAGFASCAWLARQGYHRIPNGTDRPNLWDEIEFDDPGNPGEGLARVPPAWPPHGIRVLLSDLLWLGEPLTLLSRFAERATSVVVVQILAEADVNPPQRGNVRLIDSETEAVQEIFVDALAEKRYRDNLAGHQQNWHRACRQVGATMTTVVAEKIVNSWHLEELVAAEILKVV